MPAIQLVKTHVTVAMANIQTVQDVRTVLSVAVVFLDSHWGNIMFVNPRQTTYVIVIARHRMLQIQPQ